MSDINAPDPTDPAAEALRRVLRAEAERLDPTDPMDSALTRIQARTDDPGWALAGGRGGARPWLAPLGAAAAVAAVVAAVVVGIVVWPHGGGSPVGSTSGNPQPTASTTGDGSPAPSTAPGTSSPTATAPAPHGALVPVYFGGTYAGRTMLYREYHRTTASPVLGALQAMLAGPDDSDYASLWPAGTRVTSVTRSGAQLTVTLSGRPARPEPPSGGYGAGSLQEVVYTVTATDPTIHQVTVVYPGGQSAATSRAPAVQTLASVWLLTPTGSTTSPVTLSGTASVFEATVTWEVDTLSGTKVASGTAMATIGAPARGTWSVTVSLPPGKYVAKAYAVSAKDGSQTWPDTKVFSVH
jgi:hypothetical protein